MLKKIGIHQLRLGMFVKEIGGSWMDHPFWKNSFLLDDPADFQTLKSSQIAEVLIDTKKGLDVLVEQNTLTAEQSGAEQPEPPLKQAPPPTKHTVSLEVELDQATKLVAKSKKAVLSMFQEARMGNAVNVENMNELVNDISESVSRNAQALIGLARLKTKDDYTYMHSVAVCAMMISLAKQLNLSDEEVREAGMAGLLHDIGKMAIGSDILNKPGKLTDEEFNAVKRHPEAGHEMLLKTGTMSHAVLDVCLHHHEKMDGTGYPDSLSGDQISLMAKMGAICDVYDAITSNRPYKAGWCPAESVKRMSEWTGSHFDEQIFQAFVRSIGIYPSGSLVMLKSGRLGVVVEQNEDSLLLPKVRVFFSSKSMNHIAPELLDLSKGDFQDKIVSRELASKWGFKNLDAYWLGDHAAKYVEA